MYRARELEPETGFPPVVFLKGAVRAFARAIGGRRVFGGPVEHDVVCRSRVPAVNAVGVRVGVPEQPAETAKVGDSADQSGGPEITTDRLAALKLQGWMRSVVRGHDCPFARGASTPWRIPYRQFAGRAPQRSPLGTDRKSARTVAGVTAEGRPRNQSQRRRQQRRQAIGFAPSRMHQNADHEPE